MLETVEAHHRERVTDSAGDLVLGELAPLQAERNVVEDVPVRKERIALKHHPDVAPFGRKRGDIAPIDPDGTAVGRHEPGHEAEHRRANKGVNHVLRSRLEILDLDGDGSIEVSDVPGTLIHFKDFDINGDGLIDPSEITAATLSEGK